MKLTRQMFTDTEREALEYLADGFYPNKAEAIRSAVEKAASDMGSGKLNGKDKRLRAGVMGMKSLAIKHGAQEFRMESFPLYLGPDDEKRIRQLRDGMELDTKRAAVRFALRRLAEANGFKPSRGMW